MSGVFDHGANRFFRGEINWIEDTIMGAFVSAGYVPDFQAHEFFAQVPKFARVGQPTKLQKRLKLVEHGYIDAGDLIVKAVPENNPAANAVVLFKQVEENGAPAYDKSPLLFYFDGTIAVTVAAPCDQGDEVMRVDPLWGPLSPGTTIKFPSGAVTLTQPSGAGSRRLFVDPVEQFISVDESAEVLVQNAGFPRQPNGNDMVFVFDDGPNRIVRL